jgi:hypothetical protein
MNFIGIDLASLFVPLTSLDSCGMLVGPMVALINPQRDSAVGMSQVHSALMKMQLCIIASTEGACVDFIKMTAASWRALEANCYIDYSGLHGMVGLHGYQYCKKVFWCWNASIACKL